MKKDTTPHRDSVQDADGGGTQYERGGQGQAISDDSRREQVRYEVKNLRSGDRGIPD